MDDGDVLDEELHRHPGRPASPDRSRSPLNEKIADLQYIIQPQFIAIDAIIAGEGRMLTPIPRNLNLIIMGNNQVAFDAVCCAIIGVDPLDRRSHPPRRTSAASAPLDLDEIDISGDVTLEEAKERAKGFEVGLIRVEKYFEGTNITAYAGPPPETPSTRDYCWGGCPGAIEEAIEILRLLRQGVRREDAAHARRLRQLRGPHRRGARREGRLHRRLRRVGGRASAASSCRSRASTPTAATKDPHEAKHDDIYAKMLADVTPSWPARANTRPTCGSKAAR